MSAERFHVVPHEGAWAVKAENTSGSESTHSTQRDAIDAARELCRKNEADLVIHRPDGTIRNVYVFTEVSNNGNMYDENNERRTERPRGEPSDLVSVGARISWGAILAGAFVSLSMIIGLTVLCTAIGLSVVNTVGSRELFIGAVICTLVVTMGSLFVGGFIASQCTAGESKGEAATYGVVLWGVVFAMLTALTAAGADVGYNSLVRTNGTQAIALPSQEAMLQAGLNPEQIAKLEEKVATGRPEVDSRVVAWCTFGAIMFSMAAALGGALFGAGPNLALRRLFVRRPEERVLIRPTPG